MNVIFRLIKNLIVGLIISIAISGTIFLIVELTDPKHDLGGSLLAAFIGFISFLLVLRWWDESKGKFFHEIKAMFVLCGIFSAFYIGVSVIQFLIYRNDLYLPPIAFILLILGIGLYRDVQKNTQYLYWMKTNPPYRPPSNKPKPPSEERTVHYDKYGNYKGESWKRK